MRKLYRISQSLTHLLELIEWREYEGVAFRSLTEGIETNTPADRLLMHMMGSLAQFERDLIVERSRAGVAATNERGVKFGAKYKLKPKDVEAAW